MSFLESPRFPEDIRFGITGGAEYNTTVIVTGSGSEHRNRNWSQSRGRYTLSYGPHNKVKTDLLVAFFRAVAGREKGFRFKDWSDYEVSTSDGVLDSGIGTALASYQLGKEYVTGAVTEIRNITKPVVGSVTIYRNAAPVTAGAGAGQYALDTTTGIVTFVADSAKVITGITQANPGVVTAVGHGFSTGDVIRITGVVGMTEVNDLSFTVTSLTADTFSIGVNTTAYTAYTSGGLASKFPQAADVLTWSGEFDVPVRFNTDRLALQIVDRGLYAWPQIEMIEVRE